MISCYILYSPSLDRFYIGSTCQQVEVRLLKYNAQFYPGHHFTHQASDWELYLKIDCMTELQAKKMENRIKRMKSKKYIANLKQYPEMIQKLLALE